MEGWIHLYRFWNAVLPVQVSVSVSGSIDIGHVKNMSIGLFCGIDASLVEVNVNYMSFYIGIILQ